uniref:Uncharacterized protein n=1 Tax=Arundo donax TaxID=35708 RepID=A0A0A9AYX3_ARUDO
MQRRAPMTMP